jgi:glutamate N-acetyltransferase/amino-acid N-acetyltransferase
MFISVPGGVTAAEGFQASGVPAGIKYKNKKDVALVYSMVEAAVAGVFTTNVVKAAPILLNIDRLSVFRNRQGSNCKQWQCQCLYRR